MTIQSLFKEEFINLTNQKQEWSLVAKIFVQSEQN